MNLLTNDMYDAIDSVEMTDAEKQLITDILYQERQKKDSMWDKDLEKYIINLLDNSAQSGTGK